MRISDWSSDVCSSDLDADDAHHARGLVLQDVAVEHPITGIVGGEGDLDALARRHQHGVLPLPMRGGRTVAGNKPAGVAMQADRVLPGRVVGLAEDVTATLPPGPPLVPPRTLVRYPVYAPDLVS